jgi:hypothetical protein
MLMLHLPVYGPAVCLTELGRGLEGDDAARNFALAQPFAAGT